ncbi:hypothetical protein EZS27_030293 [termite gut metagenome]|uniref:Uncharacterized protein n=1 Tax=termite gut metagenome TaxID=433724 RepID=A0A5J4QEB6_9ZZZZ
MDKFLKTAWKENNLNGEANFDIDDDICKNQLDLFEGKKLTKIENFACTLRNNLLNSIIKTNKDAYTFTLEQGHIDTHASDEVKKMKKEDLINYAERTPLLNYDQVIKNKRIIIFEIIKSNENNKNRMDG